MAIMTGGQAVVAALQAEGVRAVFGIPGMHTLHLYEALRTAPTIRHFTTRHEQGAAFMADGYARATGEPGVCLAITGPGATNTLTALGNAYCDSSPVFCITSEIATGHIGQGYEVFHELRDQLGLFAGVTAWNERAASVAEIPGAVHRAMVALRTGRPRPAHLEIPIDVLAATGEVEIAAPAAVERPAADPGQVAAAAALLARARFPLIYAGGGVNSAGASAALVSLAERLGAPVLTTFTGKGAIPEDHPLSLGCGPWRRGLIADFLARADLLLVVGARLAQVETQDWTLPLPKTLVHVDIDPTVIGRHYPATVGVVGDARRALEQITAALAGSAAHPAPSPAAEIAQWQAARFAARGCREIPGSASWRRCARPWRATPSSPTTRPWSTAGRASTCRATRPGASSSRAASRPWALPCRQPWGRRSPSRNDRWWPYAVMADSSSPRRSWPPRCNMASPSLSWSSTTAATAASPACSGRISERPSPPTW